MTNDFAEARRVTLEAMRAAYENEPDTEMREFTMFIAETAIDSFVAALRLLPVVRAAQEPQS